MKTYFVYITCKDTAEAQKIASSVVSERLAACANVMSPHQSFYWWDGAMQSEQEVAVVLKTREDLFNQLEARIVELHSYDTPCVVGWPIEKGHMPFLDWIVTETK
jgi:periplasmic divalent cation tolerance protein